MTTTSPDLAVGRVSFGRVLRSEWIKFVTLRSNLPVFGAVVVGLAVMGVLPALAARADSGLSAGVAAQDVLGSMSWVQLLVAVPAVVFFASEYSSGSARVTFLAVPTRIPVLLGKQLAIAVPAGLAGIAGAAIAFGETRCCWMCLQMYGPRCGQWQVQAFTLRRSRRCRSRWPRSSAILSARC
ncbi:hypothetical protein [Microbacterium sp. BH-3-3-3]|uniref:hypothetical protein n=1 Tax=Microbacterium sp. BH-3-3-3 TaxID=1906742 RepID=UPI00089280F5|nr:hypothetical protein [Microbacterium sp. BH-3-3-3]AOX46452.1 hypothetical protein BJP65_12095 [Microbacterium sp. BH-3-3-3]